MEFDLIERIRLRATHRDDVILGIGDDAAIVQVPAGQQLVIATDTLNAGVHFPAATAPAAIGWKALAVNLSDLAAMAAQPAWCTLSLSLPHSDPAWLDGFLDGFLALAALHRVALVGGDTTRGPLSVCVTVHGLVALDSALRRDGARVGDDIWVSGTLGDAAGALALLLPLPPGESARLDGNAVRADERPEAVPKGRNEGWGEGSGHRGTEPETEPSPQPLSALHTPSGRRGKRGLKALRSRLDRPTPRIELGLALPGLAHAAIDVSDGLLADLGHICRASNVAAELQLDALPTSGALRHAFEAETRQALQATGGDDYELCFTAPVAARERIAALADEAATAVTCIGRIVAGEGVQAFDREGRRWQPARVGYVHFD